MIGSLFVRPPLDSYAEVTTRNYQGYGTYSQYNYLRPGVVAWLKTRRFEKALRLARPWFQSANVVDFGCADGVFLPSLARYFPHVAGVDRSEAFLSQAAGLVRKLGLPNVELFCNEDLPVSALAARMKPREYSVLFLLETLEHVGDPGRMYPSKVEFLDELFSLLDGRGVVIASVPRMVGLRFLCKYLVQASLRMHHERLGLGPLVRASLFRDTRSLEPHWQGGHLGFSHLRLESHLLPRYPATRRLSSVGSVFYVIEAAA